MPEFQELTTADRLEIQELIARYSICEDTGDAEGLGALYTPTGSMTGATGHTEVGRENLVAAARKRWENPEVHRWVHWASSVVITGTADGAEAESYGMIIEPADDGYRIRAVAGKHDELHRDDGHWRFHSRVTTRLPKAP